MTFAPHVPLVGMDEINRWKNPFTGKLEPVNPPFMGGPKTMEWNYERDGQNPFADFGPIGTYKGGATAQPLLDSLDFLRLYGSKIS
tara:strand:- start:104 stop:361 length:258 start_codon:yes stop_codon:yes gene_type:complete